jgi:dUTP pyrophosphatase
MGLILDMKKYTFADWFRGHHTGSEISFFYPVTPEKGLEVRGVLERVIVNRQLPEDDVWFRVRSESGEINDFPFFEIIFEEDFDRKPWEIPVSVLVEDQNAVLPKYVTEGSAGFDLKSLEAYELLPFTPTIIRTGLRMAIPEGFELQIRSRSGLASKGVIVANSPGTIDSDYRGEIGVILINLTQKPYVVLAGERVAQAVLAAVMRAELTVAASLSETERGSGGFGSTGRS